MAKSAIAHVTISNILNTKSKDVERPKPAPVGQYICQIGQHRFDKSTQQETPFVEFELKPIEATDTVDEDALKEWLAKPDGSKKKLSEQTFRLTFYLTEAALYRLTDFLDNAEAGDEDMEVGERIAETPGKSILATVKHTTSKADNVTIYANVSSTASVE